MRLRDLPGFQDRFLVCAFGHDHSSSPVVGSFHDRPSGYGKQPLPYFNCPSCGTTQNQRIRSENWRECSSIDFAIALGNILPCRLCFKDLNDFFLEALRNRSAPLG
jgi:hypothetical protein